MRLTFGRCEKQCVNSRIKAGWMQICKNRAFLEVRSTKRANDSVSPMPWSADMFWAVPDAEGAPFASFAAEFAQSMPPRYQVLFDPRSIRLHAAQGRGRPAAGFNMRVLNKHHIKQARAMVAAAAGNHRHFLQHPQARRCFARVKQPAARVRHANRAG